MTTTEGVAAEKAFMPPIKRILPPRVDAHGKLRADNAEYCLSTILAETKRSGLDDRNLVLIAIQVSDERDFQQLARFMTRLRVERTYRREFQSRAKLLQFDAKTKSILAAINTTNP